MRPYKQKTARLNQLNQQLQRAQAKQASLKEMQENYAGYFAGVKAVMRGQGQAGRHRRDRGRQDGCAHGSHRSNRCPFWAQPVSS
ncbi:MAG: hypothetical protein U5K84_10200 [Alkalibacterium sp.]|nr:hypothetical protein [Alkalibacterium sp.]